VPELVVPRAPDRWTQEDLGGASGFAASPAAPGDVPPEADGYFVARGKAVSIFGPNGCPLVLTARMREGDATVVLLFEAHHDELIMTLRGRRRQVMRFRRDPAKTTEADARAIIDLSVDAGDGAIIVATETASELERSLRSSRLLRSHGAPVSHRLRVALGWRMHWIKTAAAVDKESAS
jgi:hypothetical protein